MSIIVSNQLKPINNPVALGDKKTRLSRRVKIESYSDSLKKLAGSDKGDMEEINQNGLTEYLVGGAYTRVLSIPEDTTIVSRLWTKDRLWILLKGEVQIESEEGTLNIKAPYIGVAPFGTKIVLYTKAETLWAAITGSNSQDTKQVENEVTTEDYNKIKYEWELLEEDK